MLATFIFPNDLRPESQASIEDPHLSQGDKVTYHGNPLRVKRKELVVYGPESALHPYTGRAIIQEPNVVYHLEHWSTED